MTLNNSGSTLLAADFLGVGETDKIMLSTIKVSGYDPEVGSKELCYIQKLNSDGSVAATYYWNEKTGGAPIGQRAAGWYYEGGGKSERIGVDLPDVEIPCGMGLWTVCNDMGYKLTVSGQVRTAEKTIPLAAGNSTPTGNIFPMTIKLSSLIVSGYDPEEGSKEVCYIQKLKSDGSVAATYYWNEKTGGAPIGQRAAGWYYEGGGKSERIGIDLPDVDINPGEGLWVVCNESGYSLTFPAIDLSK